MTGERKFLTALIRFSEYEKLVQCAEKLKFFEIETTKTEKLPDGKIHQVPVKAQCRALTFDRDLLGQENKLKLSNQSVFVKNLPRSVSTKQLNEAIEDFEDKKVKSLKISLDENYQSNQYGFVTFQNVNFKDAPEERKKLEEHLRSQFKDGGIQIEVLPYELKDRKSLKKIYNNIYVKNFPDSWSEEVLHKKFSQYGHIKSLKRDINPVSKQPFAFICFEDPTGQNKELGPICAQRAVDDLHEKEVSENGQSFRLYVTRALKKKDRESEKKKELLRYKNSKKRCNLYIKNFPPETTGEELKALFQPFGTIESIKLFPENDEKKLYAFICFEKPENAFEAKTHMHQSKFNGK